MTLRRLNYPRRALAAIGVALAVVLALGTALVVPALGSNHIVLVPLTSRAGFTDDVAGQFRLKLDGHGTHVVNMMDPSRTVVAEITVQPGAVFPWHTHPGPVIVNVASGTLVYVMASDCVHRPYPAGTAFVDPGRGHVHSAFNPSMTDVTVLIATFFEVPPAPAPLTITEGVTPADCPLL